MTQPRPEPELVTARTRCIIVAVKAKLRAAGFTDHEVETFVRSPADANSAAVMRPYHDVD